MDNDQDYHGELAIREHNKQHNQDTRLPPGGDTDAYTSESEDGTESECTFDSETTQVFIPSDEDKALLPEDVAASGGINRYKDAGGGPPYFEFRIRDIVETDKDAECPIMETASEIIRLPYVGHDPNAARRHAQAEFHQWCRLWEITGAQEYKMQLRHDITGPMHDGETEEATKSIRVAKAS